MRYMCVDILEGIWKQNFFDLDFSPGKIIDLSMFSAKHMVQLETSLQLSSRTLQQKLIAR